MIIRSYIKKVSLILVTFLLFAISISPATQSNNIQNDYVILNYKNRDIPILKEIEPVGTFQDYLDSIEDNPYVLQKISDSHRGDSPLIIIFIENDLIDELSEEIEVYNNTLGEFGYDTILFQVSGVTPDDLKNQLIFYWDEGYNLIGSVLIGNLPTEWFHHENDFSGVAEFPCDLYLMDLDGLWTDTDSDEMYDTHTDGSGDTAPEIFVGRIDASNIPGDEITTLKKYFSKVYDFWSGETNQTLYGLSYTEQDWAYIEYFRHDIGYAYEDYEAVWYPDVDRDDYVNNRITSTYEFIQLACHSSSQGHSFSIGGWASNDEIRSAPPKALFYNLFCCSSLRFTEYNCLGYAYILDTDTPSLTVVGSAKTGSMLDFRYFYEPIGNGSSFGTAFKEWFDYEYPYDDTDISWFYGMTILGDPTLIIHCPKNFPPNGNNISGPDEAQIGEDCNFCIDVFDTENDSIYCKWDWGDETTTEWTGPYSSGDTVCATYRWSTSGNYEIRVNLKDEMGSESGWSEPHTIHILESANIKIGLVKGGLFNINAEIENQGEVAATNVNWNINIDGGIILAGRQTTGILDNIPSEGLVNIESKMVLGFGKIVATIEVQHQDNTAIREVNGKVLLFYLKINPSGE